MTTRSELLQHDCSEGRCCHIGTKGSRRANAYAQMGNPIVWVLLVIGAFCGLLLWVLGYLLDRSTGRKGWPDWHKHAGAHGMGFGN
jgi:hypothetical protein